MSTHDPFADFELLLRSRYGLILIQTAEEDRAESLIRHVADAASLPLLVWTRAKGLRRADRDGSVYATTDPGAALDHIERARFPAIYQMRDLASFLSDPLVVSKLKDAARPFTELAGAIVLTGTGYELPEGLALMAADLQLPPPEVDEFRDLLRHILRDLNRRGSIVVDQTPAEEQQLLQNLKGLTLMEAEKVLTKAIVEDGRLSPDDIRKVVAAKKSLIEREGLLEYYPLEESMSEVADLVALKDWLTKRQAIISSPERASQFGLEFPKGVLLLGVPGCGKSLCAKAVAMEWSLPLLKLDPSNLYNKYIGESEKNFKRAMATAERLAPVILWIDELEKAFSGAAEQDAGVTQRILGSFLSWLQDRRGDVFVVATANDVSRLPAEFLRKGRFDEIFFVDLPDTATRRRVFEIHLTRRSQDPDRFDLEALAKSTDGFSGSEIEQVVVAGLYTAFSSRGELTDQILVHEIQVTRPLSQTMAEKISALRAWAADRTVRAN